MREKIILALYYLLNLELLDAKALSISKKRLNGGKKFLPLLKLVFKEDACSDGIRGPFMLANYQSMDLVKITDDNSIRDLCYVCNTGKWWNSSQGNGREFIVELTDKFHFDTGTPDGFANDFEDSLESIEVIWNFSNQN